tara:strand:- start:260 stop:583 length:324 start_codon:yes stop_codon:yes gene_type:complete
MTDLQKTAQLINLLRINGVPGGLLAAEILTLVASNPRTYKDLEISTGATNGMISKVVNKMTPRIKNDEVIEPRLPLIVRKKSKSGRGYELTLSQTAQELMSNSGYST